MKILVINNHSKHIEDLLSKIKLNNQNRIKSIDFKNLNDVNYNEYDAIILSGGSSFSVLKHQDEYSKELHLIKNCKKPILGICLGFELINFAFGEELKKLEYKEQGIITIKLISKDLIFDYLPKEFDVYEGHRWVVLKNKKLNSLAISKDGIEAVKHPKKKIYGVQFHPEVFIETNDCEKIFLNFLNIARLAK
ncbi:MAG: gamma-glutamyl-gamma-aminobutyrate hydrolase family protein [Candidatus Nanoarchaeia archaeon]|nr:gamma-glutamyl-gamma-aminobutyrate hydrolase family protein [Candidatus Nanoarchaeia archaeon]